VCRGATFGCSSMVQPSLPRSRHALPLLATLVLVCCATQIRAAARLTAVELNALSQLCATCGTKFTPGSTPKCNMPGCAVCEPAQTLSPKDDADDVETSSSAQNVSALANRETCLCSLPGWTMSKHTKTGRNVCQQGDVPLLPASAR
jgi:hypothetical protein